MASTESEKIAGVLERIVFYNDENHFTIGELKRSDGARETVTVTGTLPGVQCGETLELTGAWVQNRNYGRQFKIAAFTSKLPSSVHGIRKYLGSGLIPGIGKAYAERIVAHFGADTLRVISEESARLREIPGIGAARVKAIKASWEEQRALREIIVFLQTYGVTSAQCTRIVKTYGNDAKKILRENPYRLARDVDGIAFPTADKIARNLGIPNESERRLEAGVFYALDLAEQEGHAAFPREETLRRAVELLGVPEDAVARALDSLTAAGRLVALPRSALLQKPALAKAEREIAAAVSALRAAPSRLPPIKIDRAVVWAQEHAGFEFAPEQAQALATALAEKFSVVTGGPGTGKTTILRALCAVLRAKKVRVTLAAPTGRAAQRMAEAAGMPAGTIHRLLKPEPLLGGFSHDENNPLETDFVVVDETSMLDAALASALLRAVPPQAHLVFVGDVNQLPSVGAGNVLGDLIDSRRVPVTRLAAVFRQGKRSGIVSTAHGILHGDARPPEPIQASVYEFDPARDIHFIAADSQEDCAKKTVELATRAIPRLLGVRSAEAIQVLVPMHRGVVGVQNLNQQLQRAFKSGAAESVPASGGTRLEVGDKVMQNRNNYDKAVFNGDLGRVEAVFPETGGVRVNFGGDVPVDYARGELGELQLAYAVTIHKSQGSEFPVVVVPLVKAHFMMLRRNLIYTAITRGRGKVFIVGEPAAYAMAVKNAESARRWTGLPLLLAESDA